MYHVEVGFWCACIIKFRSPAVFKYFSVSPQAKPLKSGDSPTWSGSINPEITEGKEFTAAGMKK
jgi:hypothetical protein